MGLYYFRCTSCAVDVRRLMEPEQIDDQKSWLKCKACGAEVERAPRGASTSVMETVDNGWQARRIERPANVVDLVRDRNLIHDMEFETQQPTEEDLERINTDGEKI